MNFDKLSIGQEKELAGFESEANYGGNWTELVIKRAEDEFIQGQMVGLLYAHEIDIHEGLKNKKYKDIEAEGWEDYVEDKYGNQWLRSEVDIMKPKSKEEIRLGIEMSIMKARSVTWFDYSRGIPNVACMKLGFRNPNTKEKLTTQQLGIVEAHEKGHAIRKYADDTWFEEYFQSGFDIEGLIESNFGFVRGSDLSQQTKDVHYGYLFSPHEIAERMAQLKNYFGMRGAEEFTPEHLEYARIYYIEDTGLDNNMTSFFKAITSETEKRFIKVINTAGI